jgi:D-sedoheptulose 7-phosphate isomerase
MTSDNSFQDYASRINNSLNSVQVIQIEEVIKVMRECSDKGGTIWIIGNGGSASTSSHFATDLSRCINVRGEPVRGISLCDNTSLITAIGNDFSFEDIYVKQFSNLAKKDDLLISISASGNSANLVSAINYAKSNFIKTVGLTGFSGGKVRELCDFSIHVKTILGDYGVAEDSHSVICHYISSRMRKL